MHQEMQRMVQKDDGSGENTTSIDEDGAYLRVVVADKNCQRIIYGLADQSSVYTSSQSCHSTACSSRNDLELREQLKDEVRQEVREELDTKVKVLQDQLYEVKALLRALAQLTQVSSSATAPHVDDPPTNDPTTDNPPICDM